MTPEQKESIANIVSLFDKAEDKVKEVEFLAQEISIPSINELRYVGYHLARSFCEEDKDKLDTQIDKATRHCKRAIYDAHEIGIIFMLEQIKIFKERYLPHSDIVLKSIPSYTEDLVSVDKAAGFIAEIKGEHRKNRDVYYEECAPFYLTLKETLHKFNIAEALIKQSIIKKSEEDRVETRRFVISSLLTFLAIVVAIILAIVVA